MSTAESFDYYTELLARYYEENTNQDLQDFKRKIPESEWSIVVFLLQLKVKLDKDPKDQCTKPYEGSGKLEKAARFFSSVFKAKRLYTYIKFYDHASKWWSTDETPSMKFYNFVKLIFEDLKKICGFNDATDDAKVTDEYKINKIQERIRSDLEIKSNDSRYIFAKILSKNVTITISKKKEELVNKKIQEIGKSVFKVTAPDPAALTPAADEKVFENSEKLINLLAEIELKFGPVADGNHCKTFFKLTYNQINLLNIQELQNKRTHCDVFLQKYIDAFNKDDKNLIDDSTKTLYERLESLNNAHTSAVNERKTDLLNSYKDVLTFDDADNTNTKIDAKISNVLEQFYKDEKEMESTIKKLRVDFHNNSNGFLEKYNKFKTRVPDNEKIFRLDFAKASNDFLTDVLKTQYSDILNTLDSVKYAVKTKFENNDNGDIKNLEEYINKFYKPVSEQKKYNLKAENVVKTISNTHFTKAYGLLLQDQVNKINENFLNIKKITSDNYAAVKNDNTEIKKLDDENKSAAAANFKSWAEFCSEFKGLLNEIHERIHTSKVLWKLQCEKYLDENADDETILNGYSRFEECIETNYFAKIKKDLERLNNSFVFNKDDKKTLLSNLRDLFEQHKKTVNDLTGSTNVKGQTKFKYIIPKKLENFLNEVYGRGGKEDFLKMLENLESANVIKAADFTDELQDIGSTYKSAIKQVVSDELAKPNFDSNKLTAVVDKINGELEEILGVICELDNTQTFTTNFKTPQLIDEIEKHLKKFPKVYERKKIISKEAVDQTKIDVVKKVKEITGEKDENQLIVKWNKFCGSIATLFDQINSEKTVFNRKWFSQCKDYLDKTKSKIEIMEKFDDFKTCVEKNYSVALDANDKSLASISTKLETKLSELKAAKSVSTMTSTPNPLANSSSTIQASSPANSSSTRQASSPANNSSNVPANSSSNSSSTTQATGQVTSLSNVPANSSSNVPANSSSNIPANSSSNIPANSSLNVPANSSSTTQATGQATSLSNVPANSSSTSSSNVPANSSSTSQATGPSTSQLPEDQAKKYFGNIQDVDAFIQKCETELVAPKSMGIVGIWNLSKNVFINKTALFTNNTNAFFAAVSAKLKSELGGSANDFNKVIEKINCEKYSLLILANPTEFVNCLNNFYKTSFSADDDLYTNLLKAEIVEKTKYDFIESNSSERIERGLLNSTYSKVYNDVSTLLKKIQEIDTKTSLPKFPDANDFNGINNFKQNKKYDGYLEFLKSKGASVEDGDEDQYFFINLKNYYESLFAEVDKVLGTNSKDKIEQAKNHELITSTDATQILTQLNSSTTIANTELNAFNLSAKTELNKFYEKITGTPFTTDIGTTTFVDLVERVQSTLNNFIYPNSAASAAATRTDFIKKINGTISPQNYIDDNIDDTIFPVLLDTKHNDLVEYWKTVSTQALDKEIFEKFKHEYFDFEDHVLKTVYGVEDTSVKDLFKSFPMLCAVLEKVILEFKDIGVHNSIYKKYKQEISSQNCSPVSKIDETDLNKSESEMYYYFANMLSACFEVSFITTISSILQTIVQGNQLDKSKAFVMLVSYKSLVFSGKMLYKRVQQQSIFGRLASAVSNAWAFNPYTYENFLNDIFSNNYDNIYDWNRLLDDFYDYNDTGERVDVYPAKDAEDALIKIANKLKQLQKVPGGSLAPEIIKKPNLIKNAQTKKNKGTRRRRRRIDTRGNRKQTRRRSRRQQ